MRHAATSLMGQFRTHAAQQTASLFLTGESRDLRLQSQRHRRRPEFGHSLRNQLLEEIIGEQ